MIRLDLTNALTNIDSEYSFDCQIDVQPDWLPYPHAVVRSAEFQGYYCYTKPDVEVYGDISLVVDTVCDRCGKAIARKFVIPFDDVFLRNDDTGEHYTYSGNYIDLLPALREQIITTMPNTILCSPDCKGLCPKCGCDLNKERCDCK